MKDRKPDKIDPYEYSTAQVAHFYGLTAKGLAFYEDRGVLSPRREASSGYRIYTLDDCYSLYHAKLYKNVGFSIKETADLIREDSLENILNALDERRCQEMNKIRLQERILSRISEITAVLRRYQTEGTFYEEELRPAFYRLYVRNFNWEHISSQTQSKQFEQWNEVIPVDNASLLYDLESLLAGNPDLNVNIANLVEADDMQLLRFEQTEEVSYLPPVRCIKTILCGESGKINKIDWLNDALEYLHAHGYVLIGPVLTRMLMVTGSGEHRIRYDLAWFPIQSAE